MPSRAWRRSVDFGAEQLHERIGQDDVLPGVGTPGELVEVVGHPGQVGVLFAVDGRHGRGGQAAGEGGLPKKLRRGQGHLFGAGPEGGVFGGGDADADG